MDGQVTIAQDGRQAHILLDRPSAMNAVTEPMLDQLAGILGDLSTDDTTDVVVIGGAGEDFCTGSDVGDLAALLALDGAGRKAAFEHGMATRIHPLICSVIDLKQVVVVSARGHAIGLGAALILAADLAVLSETARLCLPQVALGHTVDHGESYLLPRKVGTARAMQLVLLGERLSAARAAEFGLANFVASDHKLEERTAALVGALLSGSPSSLRATKRILSGSLDRDREAQLAIEVDAASACAFSEDFVTAIHTKIGASR